MKNVFYVYRFLDKNDEIIYIGKSKNIKKRTNSHFSGFGHLPTECYRAADRIEYIEIESKIEMDIKELYYIDKIKPKYNQINKTNTPQTINFDCSDDHWYVLETKGNKSERTVYPRLNEVTKKLINSEKKIHSQNLEL